MSKSLEHQALCKDDVLAGVDNPAYDTSYATIGDRDAVTFSPTGDQVAFGQLPPYTDDRGTTGPLNCDKRMKWIAVIVSVVAVCLLIIILGCVFMIHVHPTLSDKVVDTCARVQCQHGATCVDGTSYFNCICPSGYTGLLCETDIDECGSSPCKDGAATCRDAVNGFTCDCRPGFEGDLCEIDIDECARSPCVEGAATCLDAVNNFTCQCDAGYAGRYCELDVLECDSDPCANSATCHEGVNGYVCQCDGGYTGRHCEAELNECLSNPCANGATCHDDVRGYSCQCVLGYTGRHCETDIDECSSSPCVNGATCHDGVNSHYCQCDDGFTGKYCETDHDECLSLPCFHGGTCTDGTDYYMCECPPGYTGQQCEIDVDECWSQPCQHGANCVNAINMYFCMCEPGFSGQHCESVLGTCPTGFIEYQDDGRCYFLEEDSSNQLTPDDAQQACQTKNSSLVSLETSAETETVGSHFTWEGRYHIVGARRKPDGNLYWNTGQILPSTHPKWSSDEPKSSKDCVSVIMRDGDTKMYSLSCSNARPYICERSMIYPPGISDCRIRPCMNGATCQNVTGGFYCLCTAGFTGRYCTQDVNECASNPCLNGGTCRDGFGQYTCVCVVGYTGSQCQTDIDDCASQPCNVNATCIDGFNSFSCLCPVNRTGSKCNAGVDDPCPPEFVFYPGEARCYLVKEESSDEVDWRVAETNCDAHGATLASLESPDEVDFVGALFNRQGRYHIVSARKESGIFRWNTGTELPNNHPKWKSGQPSYEDCVAAINSDGVTTLYTMGCSYDRPYVCEMPMLLPPGVNDCRSMPCRNGAECHNVNNNDHYCNCTTGFTGSQCDTDLDECATEPCENNGTCINTPGAYSCQCVTGFTGLHCGRDILECASNPCQNNGTCIDGINGYTCQCPGNYTGPECQSSPDDPCPHEFFHYPLLARCYFLEEDSDRQKTAAQAEEVCASKDSELASLETVAEVQFVGAHYTWTGRYHLVGARRRSDNIIYWNSGQILSENFPKWSSSEPQSRYDCVSTIMNDNNTKLHSLDCSYARPFVCERSIRLPPGVHSCVSMPCLHGSTCVDGNNTYTCECTAGFTGDRCETDIDECASEPCVHGGTCIESPNYYTCQCPVGYTGVNCETDIQECDSNPCRNNATCVEGINSFTCICPANFTGITCAASPTDRCPQGFIHWVDEARCYFLEEDSNRQKSYTDAQQICATKEANIASLSTDAELQFVGSQFTWTGRYHVLGARRGTDNLFRWDDGNLLPLSHPRWSSGEPGTSKECVAAIMENSITKLYGLSCSYARPYVCERGVL